MSRYLLVPNSKTTDDINFESAFLLPTDQFNGQTKQIDVPKGLLLNNFLGKGNLSKSKTLQNILKKMSTANILK